MLLDLTLLAGDPDALPGAARAARDALAAVGARVKAERRLGRAALDLALEADGPQIGPQIEAALAGLGVDLALQEPSRRGRARLLVADMDSTIVDCECLDELADFAGLKAEVAAVTERSMRGEIPFEAALEARVALLTGLPADTLERCFEERVRLIPGARTLVATLRARGVRCVLVSGGFAPFTDRAAALAGFDAAFGNRFEVAGGRLAGRVAAPILGPGAKLEILRAEAAALGIGLEAAVALGDGANDRPMVAAAGLGVAYRGKPVLRAAADVRLDHAGLTGLLHVLGFSEAEFAAP